MKENREINLAEMFWYALKGWKQILLGGLILAVLLGSYATYKNYKSAKSSSTDGAASNTISYYEGALSDAECYKVKEAVAMSKVIEASQTYLDESVLMNLDLYNENVAMTSYIIMGEDGQPANLSDLYVNYIESGVWSTAVSENLGWNVEAGLLQELVSTEFLESRDEIMSSDVFSITAAGTDSESAETLLNAVCAELEEYASSLEGYTLVASATETGMRVDSQAISQKTTLTNNLYSLSINYNSLFSAFSDTQKGYYNLKYDSTATEDLTSAAAAVDETESMLSTEETQSTEKASPVIDSKVIKYCLLGLFVGLILVFVIRILVYAFSTKVNDPDLFVRGFKLAVVGNLNATSDGNKNAICRLRYKGNNTRKEELAIIAERIKAYCKQENVKNIYMTSSIRSYADSKLLEELFDKANLDFHISCGESILYDAAAFESLSEADAVVMVEQIGKSSISELDTLVRKLGENKTKILGVIIQ